MVWICFFVFYNPKLSYDLPIIYRLILFPSENGAAVQDTLNAISGQKTVPNVYINQKHLGKSVIHHTSVEKGSEW